jgi:hypothetical protein
MKLQETTSERMLLAAAICALAIQCFSLNAQDSKPGFGIPAEITFRSADVRLMDRALLAEFSAKLYDTDAMKKLRAE